MRSRAAFGGLAGDPAASRSNAATTPRTARRDPERFSIHLDDPDGTLAVFHGPRCLARYKAGGEPIDTPTRQAA